MAALAEIIGTGVDDKRTANDALGADQLNEFVFNRATRIARGIGLEVAEVTNVAVLIFRGAMLLVVRVD